MSETEREYVLLLDLNRWKSDNEAIGGRGTTRPVLETSLTHENVYDVLGEYAENDALHPSNYRILTREQVDAQPYPVNWEDANDRSVSAETERGDAR